MVPASTTTVRARGTLLELALQIADQGIEPRNAIRFAWWGAEEAGLVGSQFYVDSLSKSEAKDIELYLNFDMIGSPNFARFVYDGDGSAFGIKGPTGSGAIEKVFEDFFASEGLASEPTAFDGRSDYDAFITAGIPAGGLFTGAEGAKTAAQVPLYGGLSTFDGASVSYDPCYHQACDSLDPIADGADAGLYEALNDAYDGALEYNGVISNINTLPSGDVRRGGPRGAALRHVHQLGQRYRQGLRAGGGGERRPARRALQALTSSPVYG